MLSVRVGGVSYRLKTVMTGTREGGGADLKVLEVLNGPEIARHAGLDGELHLHEHEVYWDSPVDRENVILVTGHRAPVGE